MKNSFHKRGFKKIDTGRMIVLKQKIDITLIFQQFFLIKKIFIVYLR